MTSNSTLGRVALLVGSSQGIGAAIALEFASRQISHLILVGRKQVLLQEVSAQITEKSRGQTKVGYVVADLSLISGMKACVKDVEDKLAGKTIDYIIESQGGPTNGVYRPTTEGLDVYFSTETLSRFAIPYLLLSSGLLAPAASLILICQPSGSTKKLPKEITVDLEDLDLGRKALRGEWGRGMKDVSQAASNTGLILDSVVLELNDRYPGISANHVFPGILPTNVLYNASLPFPSFLISSITYLVKFFAYVGITNTVEAFAISQVDLATSGKKGLWKAQGKEAELGAWAESKENRMAVWDALVALVESK